jgi:ABC-type cobalamin/Fe3+-siderophores transport system ATPase subunit
MSAEVRLVHFRVRGYRSCRDTQFSPNKGVTAIIGPNGAGKTNLLHGLMLMGISPTRNIQFSRSSEDAYTRKSTIEADFVVVDIPVQMRATIAYRPPDEGGEQVHLLKEEWQFRDTEGTTEWLSPVDIMPLLPDADARKNELVNYVYLRTLGTLSEGAQRRVFMQGVNPPPQATLSKERAAAYSDIQRFRARINYYSASQFTNPALYPTSFEIDEKGSLARDYRYRPEPPQTRFLFELYSLSQANPAIYDQYISLINDDGVGLIRSINWRAVKLRSQVYQVHAGGRVVQKKQPRTMIVPTVRIGYSDLSFNQLSEGTVRAMAMIFYIVTDESELLLLEEPEVCVHHGLLSSVVKIIKEYARSKQIVFSTHSEVAIDALTPEEVLLVDRPKSRGTIVTSIPDKMSEDGYAALKTYLATAGSLGDYWRQFDFVP